MTFGLGVITYATKAPTRSADAPNAPQKNASITGGANLGIDTVSAEVSSIYRKLGVLSRSDAVQ